MSTEDIKLNPQQARMVEQLVTSINRRNGLCREAEQLPESAKLLRSAVDGDNIESNKKATEAINALGLDSNLPWKT